LNSAIKNNREEEAVMTEGSSLENKIAQLSKHMDDQSRFTRTLVVVCTTAVMGVLFYMLTEVFTTLPSVVVTTYLGQMDTIVTMWNATQARSKNAAAARALGPIEPAAETKAPAAK
jgi:hypothetical protein